MELINSLPFCIFVNRYLKREIHYAFKWIQLNGNVKIWTRLNRFEPIWTRFFKKYIKSGNVTKKKNKTLKDFNIGKIEKNWTQWRVYSYVERRTESLGCYVLFVSKKKWNRQKLEKIEILDWDTLEILNFSYVFKWSLKLLRLADTQRRYSRLCNDVVCPLGGRYFFKKIVPSSEKLAV